MFGHIPFQPTQRLVYAGLAAGDYKGDKIGGMWKIEAVSLLQNLSLYLKTSVACQENSDIEEH